MAYNKHLFKITKKSVITAWAAWSGTAAFISAALSLALNNKIPARYSAELPFIVFIAIAAASATVWMSIYFWQRYRASQFWVPEGEVKEYIGRPYQADGDDLAELSKFASQVFGGDTMRAEVVRDVVGKRAALGVRLTDTGGKNIGFFDVFHLRPDALLDWLEGKLQEPGMDESHFEPIPKPLGDDAILELIVGAIYIAPQYSKSETGLAVAFAECCQRYLWQRCAGFSEIVLYASIFKPEGERLARIYDFENYKVGVNRAGPAKKHDVLKRVLSIDDPIKVRHGLGGTDHFTIAMRAR